MLDLQNTLQKRLQSLKPATQGVRKVNPIWEEAKQFCEYIGVGDDRKTIVQILGLCKRYGAGKVYGSRSFLKDTKFDKEKVAGLIVWFITGRGQTSQESSKKQNSVNG